MAQFTKNAINQAFVQLLRRKPFNKISVKNIVKECDINRNTFYYYYEDIYALVDDLFRYEFHILLEKIKHFKTWDEGFILTIKTMSNNKDIMMNLFNSIGKGRMEKYLFTIAEKVMSNFVKMRAEGLNVSQEKLKVIASAYEYALVGLLLDWMYDGMITDQIDIVNKMAKIFSGITDLALTNAQKE